MDVFPVHGAQLIHKTQIPNAIFSFDETLPTVILHSDALDSVTMDCWLMVVSWMQSQGKVIDT